VFLGETELNGHWYKAKIAIEAFTDHPWTARAVKFYEGNDNNASESLLAAKYIFLDPKVKKNMQS
jgi:hypothetical protein